MKHGELNVRKDLLMYAKHARNNGGLVAGQVEVTSACFQQCGSCDSWREDIRDRHVMSLETLKALCEELDDIPSFETLAITGGDPQAWPPLTEFLAWFVAREFAWSLRINTALTQPLTDTDAALWCDAFDEVRVSLDHHDPVEYQRIRGDDATVPSVVATRIRSLVAFNVNVSVLCVVTRDGVRMGAMSEWVDHHCGGIRKLTFLPATGHRFKTDDWRWYTDQVRVVNDYQWAFTMSFDDNVPDVRAWTHTDDGRAARCHAGTISFHIKPNGDWFPCCLTGGEALRTQAEFRMGNINVSTIRHIMATWHPQKFYDNDALPCRDICQYKQACINKAASDVVVLSMP